MKKCMFVSICIIIMISFVGCIHKDKNAIDALEFNDIMNDEMFELQDATDQFDDGLVESVTIALNNDYQIEFYVMPSVEAAQAAFSENKNNFEKYKSGNSFNKMIQFNNYSSYKLKTKQSYYVVSRIDNTFIYVCTEADYKESIDNILEKLGY